MVVAPGPSQRVVFLIIATSAILGLIFVTSFRSMPLASDYQAFTREEYEAEQRAKSGDGLVSTALVGGTPIAPRLGNETVKAELGRAAWKLFHTMMARFPDEPTVDESTALRDYIHLFQRLYPCGECASHFRTILHQYPPQVSSRSSAAAWACHVHNEVNKSLSKDIFDCSNIGDFYDCGCADDPVETDTSGRDVLGL